MRETEYGISTPQAVVSSFVDWFGAGTALKQYARDKAVEPLVIAGAVRSGKSTLLQHVLPGAIKAANPDDRFLSLHVNWGRLIGRTQFRRCVSRLPGRYRDCIARGWSDPSATAYQCGCGFGSLLDGSRGRVFAARLPSHPPVG